MRRPAQAAEEDRAIWHRAVRDVAPLGGRSQPRPSPPPLGPFPPNPSPPSPPPPSALSPSAPARPHPATRHAPTPPLDRFAGIDRASAERLKRGLHPIEARLDLHGMTQSEAHNALARFVEVSRAAGRRCVLVITGRGAFGGGVLKGAVPRWLDEPTLRRHLLASAPAQPRNGGSGALYLLLRRHRGAGL